MIASALMLVMLTDVSGSVTLYKNPDYMISGFLKNATICTGDSPGANNGFTAYFDTLSCSRWTESRPRIDFLVVYNVPYESVSTLDLAGHLCGTRNIVKSSLRVDKLEFVACRQPDDHGLAVVDYIALRPPVPSGSDDLDDATVLDFTIYARPAELPLYRRRTYQLAAELHLTPEPRR